MTLQIRQCQFEQFSELGLRRFVQEQIPRFRDAHPERTQGLSDEDLTERWITACREAIDFGIDRAGWLRGYLEADLVLGRGFASEEALGLSEMLRAGNLDPAAKVDRLADAVVFGGR